MYNSIFALCLLSILNFNVSFKKTADATPIVKQDSKTQIVVDKNDYKGVHIAAEALVADILAVTGKTAALTNEAAQADSNTIPVIVGTLGKSASIDRLVKEGCINISDLKGKWESFVIATVPNPSGSGNAVAIAGSDKRGTIYGIYELSRAMGVSPWYWWADVPTAHHDDVYLNDKYFASGEPAVKYRGIFINDENPCMQTWAREKFGNMNGDMYKHVYELLLRLRANLLWPGMWGAFPEDEPDNSRLYRPDGSYEGNCFNEDDLENPAIADRYGIVIGTSHHEQFQRSQQEWFRHRQDYGNGEWNYKTNRDGVRRFWRDGMEHTKNYESIITMGMRGDDDKPMVDQGSAEENFRTLGQIIKDQRKIIADVTKKPASKTPQVWTLYSEQLDYFDDGLDVPDDIIIVLCDDNYGDVRRLPSAPRKGGYGMYYHVSYYGAPRAQKWLNMSQIQQHWEQLQATYDYGVDKLWILNVGDIKPHEFPTTFFMDMAWNPKAFNADNLFDYTKDFYSGIFGNDRGAEIADILDTHNKYTAYINAELLNPRTYNLASGEYERVTNEYLALEGRALRQMLTLPKEMHDAYWQLVLYPVSAMANLYQMYYSAAKNSALAQNNDPEANIWAEKVQACFERDSLLSHYYNHEMSNGKWNHMMDQKHIGFRSWHTPKQQTPPRVTLVNAASDKDQWVFSPLNKVCAIEAEHTYNRIDPAEDTKWTIVPNLGRTLSTIALMPYNKPVGGGALEYCVEIPEQELVNEVTVHVVLRSTMPFVKGGHGYRLSMNGGKAEEVYYNQDMNWKNVYNRMYPAAADRAIETICKLPLEKTSDNKYILRFEPLAPGVALEKIVVDLGGYAPSRLFGNESPHKRVNNVK